MIRKMIMLSIVTAAIAGLAGCKKENSSGNLSSQLSGQWELCGAELATKSVTIGQEKISVYIEFNNDGSFILYQQLGAGRFVSFDGNWTLSGDILSGRYSDNTSWGSDYRISIEGDSLTMSVWPAESDIYHYTRSDIPDGILAGLPGTKSGTGTSSGERFL